MGEQLSFENDLYERERQLLLVLSELTKIRNNMHFLRTRTVATELILKVKRHKKAMKHSEEHLTSVLEWIAHIEYEVSKDLSEIGSMAFHELGFFKGRIETYTLAPDTASNPVDLYNTYIRLYKNSSELFNKNSVLLESLALCKIYIREFYEEMQKLGKELEEVL